jgi:putative transcriptional regulator
MQLASNLSLLMGKHRYNIQDVHEKTGLARRTISALYNDKATRIDFSTVEKLCQLFECGINQLFILCDDKKQQLHIAVKENTQ